MAATAEPAQISRRDMLRRGAVVGGTLVWAAPAVQTFVRPAFAGTVEDDGFSYFAFTLEKASGEGDIQTQEDAEVETDTADSQTQASDAEPGVYRAKYEGGWVSPGNTPGADCTPARWGEARRLDQSSDPRASEVLSGPEGPNAQGAYTFRIVAEGWAFVDATVKHGPDCSLASKSVGGSTATLTPVNSNNP